MSVVMVCCPIFPLASVFRLTTVLLFVSWRSTLAPETGAFNVSTIVISRVNARSTTPVPVPLNWSLVVSNVELIRVAVALS